MLYRSTPKRTGCAAVSGVAATAAVVKKFLRCIGRFYQAGKKLLAVSTLPVCADQLCATRHPGQASDKALQICSRIPHSPPPAGVRGFRGQEVNDLRIQTTPLFNRSLFDLFIYLFRNILDTQVHASIVAP